MCVCVCVCVCVVLGYEMQVKGHHGFRLFWGVDFDRNKIIKHIYGF